MAAPKLVECLLLMADVVAKRRAEKDRIDSWAALYGIIYNYRLDPQFTHKHWIRPVCCKMLVLFPIWGTSRVQIYFLIYTEPQPT